MNWISVKDKLPERNDAFWVYSHGEDGDIDDCYSLFGIAQWSEKGWDILGNQAAHPFLGFKKLKHDDVTHWMPLPDCPK